MFLILFFIERTEMIMKALHINERDNVLVVVASCSKGEEISFMSKEGEIEKIIVNQDILVGHKVALLRIHREEMIIKYGCPIGKAIEDIEPGEWVHTHNLRTVKGTLKNE